MCGWQREGVRQVIRPQLHDLGQIEQRDEPTPHRTEASQAIALRPLRVSGLVVHKAEIIEALRVYAPNLSDLQVTEDGEHFWLMLDEREEGRDGDPATQK